MISINVINLLYGVLIFLNVNLFLATKSNTRNWFSNQPKTKTFINYMGLLAFIFDIGLITINAIVKTNQNFKDNNTIMTISIAIIMIYFGISIFLSLVDNIKKPIFIKLSAIIGVIILGYNSFI